MSPVKPSRAYDSTRRREQARQNRQTVLEVATGLFEADGYGATTMASIATAAGVSVETVYKAFGNKAGLLRAIAEDALAGPEAVPTMQQSDEAAARASDPHALIERWAQFYSEVTPRLAPVVLLIRAASVASPDAAELLAHLDAQRLDRMAHQARLLRDRGFLRPDRSVTEARDVMWAYTDPALYELLVLRQGWPTDRFRAFIGDALRVALLPPVWFQNVVPTADQR
jgi:AcrR family transcriptional regulator